MADLVLTQAQLDAMLAKGELSLTPPEASMKTKIPEPAGALANAPYTPTPPTDKETKAPVDVAGLFGGIDSKVANVVPVPKVEPDVAAIQKKKVDAVEEVSGRLKPTLQTAAVPGMMAQEGAVGSAPVDVTTQDEELLPLPNIKLAPLRPAPRMSKSRKRKYDTALMGQTNLAAKIEDPRLRQMAGEAVIDGAKFSDIAQTVGALIAADKKLKRQRALIDKRRAAKEAAEKKEQALKAKITMTRDTKKVSPKIVNQWGKFAAASEYIEKLMDNYDDSEVGMFDASAPVQWAKRQMGGLWGDQNKRSQRDNAYSGLESSIKEAFGYGANYQGKEIEMMQRYIPSQTDGEEAYKLQMVSALEGIKNELYNSVKAQKLGKRDSDKFNAFLSEIDARIAKAKKFAGVDLGTGGQKGDDIPASLVSVGASGNTPAATPKPKPKKTVRFDASNLDALDALLGGN